MEIILEDCNFCWSREDMKDAIEMWNLGIPITLMAENFGTDEDEVFLLLLHLSRRKKIAFRPGAIFGKGVVEGERDKV